MWSAETISAMFVCFWAVILGILWVLQGLKNKVDINVGEHRKRLAELAKDSANQFGRLHDISAIARRADAQIKGLMAIDWGYKDVGWLILITKVNGQDRVHLKQIRPDMSLQDYRYLVEQLKHDYGGVLTHFDAPKHTAQMFWDT